MVADIWKCQCCGGVLVCPKRAEGFLERLRVEGEISAATEKEIRGLKLQIGELQKKLDLESFRVRYLREVLERIVSFRGSGCSTGEAISRAEFRAKEALELTKDECAEKMVDLTPNCLVCSDCEIKHTNTATSFCLCPCHEGRKSEGGRSA